LGPLCARLVPGIRRTFSAQVGGMDERHPLTPADEEKVPGVAVAAEENLVDLEGEEGKVQAFQVSLSLSASMLKDSSGAQEDQLQSVAAATDSRAMDSFTIEYAAENAVETSGASSPGGEKESSDTGIASEPELTAIKAISALPKPRRLPTSIVVERPPEDEEVDVPRRPASPPTPPLILPKRAVGIRVGGANRRVSPSPEGMRTMSSSDWRPQSVWERRLAGEEPDMAQQQDPFAVPRRVADRRLSTVRNVRTARKIRSMRKKVSIRRTQVRGKEGESGKVRPTTTTFTARSHTSVPIPLMAAGAEEIQSGGPGLGGRGGQRGQSGRHCRRLRLVVHGRGISSHHAIPVGRGVFLKLAYNE